MPEEKTHAQIVIETMEGLYLPLFARAREINQDMIANIKRQPHRRGWYEEHGYKFTDEELGIKGEQNDRTD